MASPTPSASCPPCSDTPLAITTSVITFLTFFYALTVGLIYYHGLTKTSPEEATRVIKMLSDSLKEIQTMAQTLDQTYVGGFAEQRAEDEATIPIELMAELFDFLRQMIEEIMECNPWRRNMIMMVTVGQGFWRTSRGPDGPSVGLHGWINGLYSCVQCVMECISYSFLESSRESCSKRL